MPRAAARPVRFPGQQDHGLSVLGTLDHASTLPGAWRQAGKTVCLSGSDRNSSHAFYTIAACHSRALFSAASEFSSGLKESMFRAEV